MPLWATGSVLRDSCSEQLGVPDVRQGKISEILCVEPVECVVLGRLSISNRPSPRIKNEDRHLDVIDPDGLPRVQDRAGNVDRQLLGKLSCDRLGCRFSDFDVATGQVPHIRVVRSSRVTMTKENSVILEKHSSSHSNRHAATLETLPTAECAPLPLIGAAMDGFVGQVLQESNRLLSSCLSMSWPIATISVEARLPCHSPIGVIWVLRPTTWSEYR